MSVDLKSETSLLEQTLQLLCDCSDLSHLHLPLQQIDIIYFGHLVSTEALRKDALEPFNHKDADMVAILSQSSYITKLQASELVTGILAGNIAIYYKNRGYLHEAYAPESRSIQKSETESVISGPLDSFTESLNTNLSLLRRRIKDPGLKAITFTIGTRTGTTMVLLYLEELAEPAHVQQLSEMIENLDIQTIFDTNTLTQHLTPNKLTIFPQFLTSVRPDLIADKLTSGKIVGLLDGSPFAFSAPTSFVEFFSSPDDYYQPWAVASALRILSFIALFITLCFTAFYVSLVTVSL